MSAFHHRASPEFYCDHWRSQFTEKKDPCQESASKSTTCKRPSFSEHQPKWTCWKLTDLNFQGYLMNSMGSSMFPDAMGTELTGHRGKQLHNSHVPRKSMRQPLIEIGLALSFCADWCKRVSRGCHVLS